VVLCASVMFAGLAQAGGSRTTSAHSGDYLTILLYGALAQMDDIKANTGTVVARHDEDGTGGIGLAIGYNWAKKGLPIRSELEYNFRFRYDFDIRVTNQAGYENNLLSHVFFANAYYDIPFTDRWTAYVGGGMGLSMNRSEVERTALLGGAKSKRDDSTTSFAWNLGFGFVWQAWTDWDLEFRYRYADLGEIESGPHSDGTVITTDSYISHDFMFGIVYRF
jgi:opacity protein-like surface antigen